MSGFWSGVHRFWFEPVPSSRLAALRFVTCAYVVYKMLAVDLRRLYLLGNRPLDFMDPATVFSLIPLPFPLSAEALTVFGVAMALLGLMAAVGLFTRPALLLFALGYLWMGAAISSWGYVTHSRILPLQVLLILAFAPGSAAWSLDRAILWLGRRQRRARESLRSALAGPLVPGWGVQLTVVLVAALLFSAGLSKLRYSGLQWADGQTLGFYLSGRAVANSFANVPADIERPRGWAHGIVQFVGRPGLPPEAAWKDGVGLDGYLYRGRGTSIGVALAARPRALAALSAFTMLIELAAPLLLLKGLIRSLYLIAASGFLVGIWLSMGINFIPWVVVLLCLVEWRRLAVPLLRIVPAWSRAAGPAVRPALGGD